MHFIIYKITNTINGKFYIGSHRTKNINDRYMGSGKLLKRAFEKYGIENFTKEILFVFDNSEDMYAKEAEIVNADFLLEENTYNVKIGGFGGWDYSNSSGKAHRLDKSMQSEYIKLGRLKLKELYKDPKFKTKVGKSISDSMKRKYDSGYINPFKNKCHSQKTIEKIKVGRLNKGLGSSNSQFGTCWITNGQENKKIKKEDIDNWINIGYYKGRIMKND